MNGQKLLKDGTLVVPVDVVDLMDVDRVMLEQNGTKFCSFFYRDEIIRCKDCKYRKVNDHYGEKGYMNLKAICELDTGDIFQLGRDADEDDWFCADAERREGDADAD